MLIEFIIITIFFWILIFVTLLWLDLKINIFYSDFYSLYNILLFVIIVIWFLQLGKIITNRMSRINILYSKLIDKWTEKFNKNAINLKNIYNFINNSLGYIAFFMIFSPFIIWLDNIVLKNIILSIYFSIVLSLILIFKITVFYLEEKLRKEEI